MKKKPWHCDECGSPLIQVPSGSVCPEGHGRLQMKMPRDVAQVNECIIGGMPRAELSGGSYMICGRDGRFKRRRKFTGSFALARERMKAEILAIADGGVYSFEQL